MTVCIIQARTRSSRLPRKVTAPINDLPMLRHVVERAKQIPGVKVVVNCPDTDRREFLPLVDVPVHGVVNQEEDVLGSFREIALRESATAVMRLTADCPLLDPFICQRVLSLYRQMSRVEPYGFFTNDTTRSGYPDGTDCEVFSMNALNLAYDHARVPAQREHVTLWMRQHLPTYGIFAPTDYSATKLSVDTKEDLERVRAIFRRLPANQCGIDETLAAWKHVQRDGVNV